MWTPNILMRKLNWNKQALFRELKLPTCVPLDRLNTFLAMYRVHHQHLHQAIVRSWISKLFVFMILTWSIIEFDHFFQETLFICPVTNIVLSFSFSDCILSPSPKNFWTQPLWSARTTFMSFTNNVFPDFVFLTWPLWLATSGPQFLHNSLLYFFQVWTSSLKKRL